MPKVKGQAAKMRSLAELDPDTATEKEKVKLAQTKFVEKQAEMLARHYKLPYIDLYGANIYAGALAIIPKAIAERARIGCFFAKKEEIHIGLVDPQDEKTIQAIEALEKKGYKIKVFVISEISFQKILDSYQEGKKEHRVQKETAKVEIRAEELTAFQQEIKNLADLKEKVKTVSTTELIETVVAGAVKLEASDIHFEPQPENLKIRYRIDGVLQDVITMPIDIYPQMLSRLKLMSGMKLNVTAAPQDGKFTIKLKEREIDVRSSILPSAYGETMVLRLLGIGVISVQLEDLGLRGQSYEIVEKQLKKPNGMILTTGPTGSGKTTTLYAFVNQVNRPEVKIITIENPIEYHIKGISQTQTSSDEEYGFANGLKAIMRQDPDIILVGEIRDFDAAEIALQAALTGHLVFSTLHTNDSAGVIPRLINMGARPFTIAPALNCAIAQRLVRVLCKDCRGEYKPDRELRKKIHEKFYSEIMAVNPEDDIDPDTIIAPAEAAKMRSQNKGKPLSPLKIPNYKVLYRPRGCAKCNHTGYRGRIAIFEVFEIDSQIEKMAMEAATISEIRQYTVKNGMESMAQDGINKMAQGITSFDEVERVT